MKKALQTILGLSTAVALTGCAVTPTSQTQERVSTPQRASTVQTQRINTTPTDKKPTIAYIIPDNIEAKVQNVSSEHAPFSAYFQVIYGDMTAAKPNITPEKDEYGFMFQRWDDTSLLRNNATGKQTLESDIYMIPTIVRNNEGNPAIRAPISPRGNNAMKAKVTDFLTDGVTLGTIDLTHEDVRYTFITLEIGEKGNSTEYFFPRVETSSIVSDGSMSNFYLIPVDGTNIRTELSNGNLTLENPEGLIARPMRVSSKDYNNRSVNTEIQSRDAGTTESLEYGLTPIKLAEEVVGK